MAIFSSSGDAPPIALFKLLPSGFKSLPRRDFLLALLWSTVGILMVGFFISSMYRKTVETHFHELLRAELYHVIDAVEFGDQGLLVGSPQLGDLRFNQPKSGWYWMAEPGNGVSGRPVVSPSMGGSSLPVVPELEASLDQNRERFYDVTDASGNRVKVAETQVVLAADGRFARFRVTGNAAVVEEDIRDFNYRLYLALGGFGAASLIVYRLTRQTL